MTRHIPRSHRHHGLPRWQRLVLHATGGLLLVTGVAWLGMHYLLGAGAGELPHPLEPWAMKLHGLAGFAALFMTGVLAGAHIPQGWRMSARHRYAGQRDTGLALTIAAALLAFTGYLLYYFAPEAQRPALGWIHSGIGVFMVFALLIHRQHPSRHLRD